jgi:hypothetical protein
MANEYPAEAESKRKRYRLHSTSWGCQDCGALVGNQVVHDQFHSTADAWLAIQKVIGTKGNYNFSQIGHTHKGIRQLIVRKSK